MIDNNHVCLHVVSLEIYRFTASKPPPPDGSLYSTYSILFERCFNVDRQATLTFMLVLGESVRGLIGLPLSVYGFASGRTWGEQNV